MDVIANCKAGDFKEKIINNPYEVEILKKKVQLKTFVVVIKPKIEIYQGTQKVKYNVLKIIEVSKNAKSFQEEAETLIQNFTSRFFK